VIGIVAGIVLLAWPLSGALSLTLILTVFLVLEGVVSILYALEHKRELSGRWGMMLFSGVVDLVLAGIIFAGLPARPAWAIGLLVGINLVFGGSALIRHGFARAQHRSGRQSVSSGSGTAIRRSAPSAAGRSGFQCGEAQCRASTPRGPRLGGPSCCRNRPRAA